MVTVNLSSAAKSDAEKASHITERAAANLRDCYQCGKCSAGCPMADAMDLGPQQIIRMLQLGLTDRALAARGPWLCAQCMTCSSRCPQNIPVDALMLEVRRTSHAEGRRVVPESDVFETLFIKGVRSKGLSNEQYLAAQYNLASGHLMQDVMSAPQMLAKGLIGVLPHSSQNPAAVRRLVDRCAEMAKEGEQHD